MTFPGEALACVQSAEPSWCGKEAAGWFEDLLMALVLSGGGVALSLGCFGCTCCGSAGLGLTFLAALCVVVSGAGI